VLLAALPFACPVAAGAEEPPPVAEPPGSPSALETPSHGLAGQPPGLGLGVSFGAGHDSEAQRTGPVSEAERAVPPGGAVPSEFLTGDFYLRYRFRAAPRLSGSVLWSSALQTWASARAQEFNLEEHALSAMFEYEPQPGVRMSALVAGDFAFTGQRKGGFFGSSRNDKFMTALTGPTLVVARDWSDRWTTSVQLEWRHGWGFNEFGYLGGDRLAASVWQTGRLGPLLLNGGVRLRRLWLGSALTAVALAQSPPPAGLCPGACFQEATEPFGYLGEEVRVAATFAATERLQLDLGVSAEHRGGGDVFVTVVPDGAAPVAFDRRQRSDVRFGLRATATFNPLDHISLWATYDLLLDRSSLDPAAADDPGTCGPPAYLCHQYDPLRGSYQKHTLSAGLRLSI
jgi:hypothetical protein